ncbi:transglycosylase SLT domain-containing protein [Nocardia cyriacigeorgica]|uniref:Transglycosylase SLT domain-containing protein n=1 Tax=Nocardia cyriacigeorgica TaxID=135487 RepID=A0A6P1D1M5_9NOCA|nr:MULTISPECIES: bifunctional lytic transglycosylase/C40 family peptidase [Nocardia]NEW36525.1 transglycosylase SLT domain-containing protein [Nocardia cyriacigeorgica]BDT85618.1 hydrolase Nlp/P60 [Nocardia cyriacigeorgica]
MLVKTLGAGCATVVFLVVVIAAVVTTVVVFDQSLSTPAPPASTGTGSTPSPEAEQDIPAQILVLYQAAAQDCPGLDWSVLAAIGKIETDHGRSPLPGVSSGENASGAGGPMQFLAATFESVTARHPLPAGGANPPSRYNPSDAIHAAAFYLCDSGAPADLHAAIFAYNHADWYVNQVLDQAARYRATDPSGGDCHTAPPPNPTAAQVISFACAQLGQPYVWGGNGPEVNGGWDCSGLTQAAYRSAGISIPRTTYDQVHTGTPISEDQLAPGHLVFYGTAADVHHVGIYLGGGHMVHAPTFDEPVQISPYRWAEDDFYTATSPITGSPSHADSRATP